MHQWLPPFPEALTARQTSRFTHLPLFDHGAHFIPGEVHSMEVGQTIFALNVLSYQLKFTEGNLIILQISQAHFKYATLQPIRGNFCVTKQRKPFINIRNTLFKSNTEFPFYGF